MRQMYRFVDFIWIIGGFFSGLFILGLLEWSPWHLGIYLSTPIRLVFIFMSIAIIGFGVYRLYHMMYGLDSLAKKMLTTNESSQLFTEIELESSSSTVQYCLHLVNRYRKQYHDFNHKRQSHFVDVIESMVDCVIVLNKDGIITLFNHNAEDVLGKDKLCVGSSIFSVFRRGHLSDVLSLFPDERRYQTQLLSRDKQKIDVWITPLKNQGFVICFDAHMTGYNYIENASNVESGVYHDFSLHQKMPEKIPVSTNTPIEELLSFVFDIESTGLDIQKEAAISLGGVYCHGVDIYSKEVVDELIFPDVMITKKSQQIHGISNEDVEGKPTLKALWEQGLQHHLNTPILVGHQIGFDISLLRYNLSRQSKEIQWNPAYFLDTMILAHSLIPQVRDEQATLESLASFFQISVWGRHTALGDALITATIFSNLLKLALEVGDKCLGDLLVRQAKVSLYRNAYKSQGWVSLPEV